MNYRSYQDLINDSKKLAQKIQHNYAGIISIPRSGNIPSSIISLYHNIPWFSINDFFLKKPPSNYSGRVSMSGRVKGKYLLVDDTCRTGGRMNKALQDLSNLNFNMSNGYEIHTAVIYNSNLSKQNIKYFIQNISDPRVFEWNLFHHECLSKSALDIDGVVCVDPPKNIDEVKNEQEYINYITNAPVLNKISVRVNCFVTSRLEKYRTITENWLHKNNFRYNKLVMSPYLTAQERRSANNHGFVKGKYYKENKNLIFFIESNIHQAKSIKDISNKPVYCTDSNKML